MKNTFLQKMIQLWKEFLPLSVSDVTMALSDPIANGALAQLPRIQTNLGALGIIKAIVVLFESPIIMILHASNALSSNKNARTSLGKLVFIACVILTSLLGILALPFCFFPLMENIIGIPTDVTKNAHTLLLCLLCWPASIAIRRYFQGILIIHGQSKTIARAGFLRLFVLFLCLVTGYFLNFPANILAGSSLMISIFSEMGMVAFCARKYKPNTTNPQNDNTTHPKTLKDVWRFYWPLAHSMILVWGGRAILIVLLAQAIDSRSALAIWPLTWSLVILFANATRMVQQVLIRNKDSFHPVDFIFFGISAGGFLSVIILLISSSFIGEKFLDLFCGQDVLLLTAVKKTLTICSIVPTLVALQNVLQGFLMSTGNTKSINRATLCGTVLLLISSYIGINLKFFGATVAAYSMLIALMGEILILVNQVSWKISIHKYLQQQKIQEGV